MERLYTLERNELLLKIFTLVYRLFSVMERKCQ